MLVLSRHKGESVIITAGKYKIRVMAVDYRKSKIRIGFDAPPEVTVHREEIQKLVDEREAQK